MTLPAGPTLQRTPPGRLSFMHACERERGPGGEVHGERGRQKREDGERDMKQQIRDGGDEDGNNKRY